MAFTQTIYNQKAEEKTDEDELIENEPEHEEEEDIFSVDERDDAEQENHFDDTEAGYDSSEENDANAADADYLDIASDHGNSTQTSGGDSETRQDDDGSLSDEVDPNGESGSEDENVSDGESGGTGSEGGDLLSVDLSIEHLHTADCVFATGSAALLVQMLGGEGKLAGCDADTLSAMRGYFPASELTGVAAIWEASGKSDLAARTVNEMETLPEYCLYDANDISTGTVRTLTGLGVTCIELDFRYATGILNAVETVREILNTDYADQMARQYTEFYDGVIKTLSGTIGTYSSGGVNYDCKAYGKLTTIPSTCTNGLATLFVSAWDEHASMTIYRDDVEWSVTYPGLAVANVSYTNSPISYFMSIAGVENKGASAATNTGGKATYIYTFGFASAKLSITKGTLASNYETGLTATLASGLGGLTDITTGVNGIGTTGGTSFPAIVVASNAVKEGILDSDMWKVYPYDEQGGNTRGFYDGKGTLVRSLISDEYGIYVNPQGLGNWITGSAESILEAPWIASVFHPNEAYSESDVRSLICEFYSTFYRCDLSSAQLDAILAGV